MEDYGQSILRHVGPTSPQDMRHVSAVFVFPLPPLPPPCLVETCINCAVSLMHLRLCDHCGKKDVSRNKSKRANKNI